MTHFYEPLFEVPGYRVKHVLPEDIDALQALLENSSDYSQLVTGLPPGPSAAYSLLTECPAGKTPDDKFVIGLSTERQDLIGVLDIIRDYPVQNDWWLGLLLDPAYRGQGLGQRVFRAFEQWVRQHDARRICLGVVEQNQRAYRFWQTMGFEPVERRPAKQFGKAEHVVIVMAYALTRDRQSGV
jgi:RimJ/RimL family protein N-acetyltransferase